ncbi:membrane carboxypeptidase/penicillin-binding protein [Catalinimonas alkaloidigena]|uniref:transglycosylase domain-containing protein n=1 Tax=Catalinimonas alkaloidigena TaxID=1075417 RepID=UPI00240651BA|nr:transglycosylase domain-containing protein [Catalinimonas alkaloidigena]MDF9795727.1 membrane carboxypeptidase/penicillin-binding protein [Catalinimonas alkaloidigena]
MLFIKRTAVLLGFVLLITSCYYTIVVLEARNETPRIVQSIIDSDKIKLKLADFTERQIDILLSVQDPKFYEHKGIDLKTPGAGKTTLAQGLCKFYYFDGFKRGWDKIKLMLITRYAFDPLVTKDTQMLLIINDIYLGSYQGQHIRGFEDAAQVYFDKTFKELSEDEYISLVAMIRRPNGDNIKKKPKEHELRVMRVNRFLKGEYTPQDNSDQFYDRD